MDGSDISTSTLDTLTTVEFKSSLRGYAIDEVDDFLDRAAVEVEHLREQIRQQQQQLQKASERIQALESERRAPSAVAATPPPAPAPTPPPAPVAAVQATPTAAPARAAGAEQIAEMIAMAQEFVAHAQEEAEQRAKHLTGLAQERAREIVSEAQSRASDEIERLNGLKRRLSEDVEKLAAQVEQERTRLRTQLTAFLQWVDENVQSHTAVAAVRTAVPAAPTPSAPAPAQTIGERLNFDQSPPSH